MSNHPQINIIENTNDRSMHYGEYSIEGMNWAECHIAKNLMEYWRETYKSDERWEANHRSMYHIAHKDNPKVDRMNELVDEYEKLRKELEAEGKELWKDWKPTWKYTVYVKIGDGGKKSYFSPAIPEGQEYIEIVAQWSNKEEYEALRLKSVLSSPSMPDGHHHSVSYYRVEGVLVDSRSGGWMLLKTPAVCNDQDWEDLKAGNLDKYLTKGW